LSYCRITHTTRHRASTSTRWHFPFALCCHSNATRAPIANPPNSAQLGGNPYHSQVTSGSVQQCGNAAADRQTDTRDHIYISRRLPLTLTLMRCYSICRFICSCL